MEAWMRSEEGGEWGRQGGEGPGQFKENRWEDNSEEDGAKATGQVQ